MFHQMSVELAEKYGVNEALVIHHLAFWIAHNKANETNFYDGRYWTFNSRKAFAEQFSYLSKDQMRRILKKLTDKGFLLTGNYNTNNYDKTLWYSFSDSAIEELEKVGYGNYANSEWQKTHIDVANLPNGSGNSAKPIPDIIPNNSTSDISNIYSRVVDHLNEMANTHYKSNSKKTQQLIRARLNEGFTVDDFLTVIDKKCAEWVGTKFEQYLKPDTLFSNKFEGYLNQQIRKEKDGLRTGNSRQKGQVDESYIIYDNSDECPW